MLQATAISRKIDTFFFKKKYWFSVNSAAVIAIFFSPLADFVV